MLVHPDPLRCAITTAVSEHIAHTERLNCLQIQIWAFFEEQEVHFPHPGALWSDHQPWEAQAQARPHCQAPTRGGVRAERAAGQHRLLLSSHQLRMPTVDHWFGFQYEGPKSAYTWYRQHIFISQGLDFTLKSVLKFSLPKTPTHSSVDVQVLPYTHS